MQAANGTDVTPFVRVAWNDIVLIKQALDIGAEGLVIPWVNTKEDAIKAVRAAKYPPLGVRGVGPGRSSPLRTGSKIYGSSKRPNDDRRSDRDSGSSSKC